MKRLPLSLLAAGAASLVLWQLHTLAASGASARADVLCQATPAVADPGPDAGSARITTLTGTLTVTDATSVSILCAISHDSQMQWNYAVRKSSSPGATTTLLNPVTYPWVDGEPLFVCGQGSWTTASSATYTTPISCHPIDDAPTPDPSSTPSPTVSATPTTGTCPPGEIGAEVGSDHPQVGPIHACVTF